MSTIASVAALAGVGVGTVSRVLNDSTAVRGCTRMRVLEAIEALEYEPSAARALSTGRTSTIGVVAPFFTEPSVVERLRGVMRRLASSGYSGLTTVAQPLEESGVHGAEMLLAALAGGEPGSQDLRLVLQVRGTTAPPAGSSTHTEESRPVRTRLLNGMMREFQATRGRA